jgi:hypothetical protein
MPRHLTEGDAEPSAGTYGDSTHVAKVTVDENGLVTAVEEVAISGGGGGGAVDSVNGQTGEVVLDLDDLEDGETNKAFTSEEKDKLSGIEPEAQVNNLADADASELISAGDTSLHYHSSDRDRANHTGTQSADSITDGTTNKAYTATEKTKLSGIEAGADVTDATNVAAAGAVMESDASTASMSFVVDEDDMSSNSATKVPTQQSVKAYVDTGLSGKANSSHTHTASQVTDFSTAADARVSVRTQAKSFFLESPAAADDLPVFRFDAASTLTKVVYAISGGTNWVGQLQEADDAQGTSASDTQSSDSTVTGTTTVTTFSNASFDAGDYLRLKTTSVSGSVSWLHVTFYYAQNA